MQVTYISDNEITKNYTNEQDSDTGIDSDLCSVMTQTADRLFSILRETNYQNFRMKRTDFFY